MQEHRIIHYPVCNSDLTYSRDTNIFNFTLPVITTPLIYRGEEHAEARYCPPEYGARKNLKNYRLHGASLSCFLTRKQLNEMGSGNPGILNISLEFSTKN